MVDKTELLEQGVTSDDSLGTMEKETSMTFPTDRKCGLFHSDVPTTIKWFLSVEETEVTDYRQNDEGEVVEVRGEIPKSIIRFQASGRKSDLESKMVSYGPNK